MQSSPFNIFKQMIPFIRDSISPKLKPVLQWRLGSCGENNWISIPTDDPLLLLCCCAVCLGSTETEIHHFMYCSSSLGFSCSFGSRPVVVLIDWVTRTRLSRSINPALPLAGLAATAVVLQLPLCCVWEFVLFVEEIYVARCKTFHLEYRHDGDGDDDDQGDTRWIYPTWARLAHTVQQGQN